MSRITIKQVNEAIHKVHPTVTLVKGKGYFYLIGDGAANLYTTGIYVAHLTSMTIDEWVATVNRMINSK